MHPLLTNPLDRLAMLSGWLAVRRPRNIPGRVTEANALLQRPDFLGAGAGAPPELAFTPNGRFVFPSFMKHSAAENNTVQGRLFRCSGDWRRQATVIVLHGWNDELNFRLWYPWLARWLVHKGVNAALIQLPCHGRRKPRPGTPVRNFISEDLLHVALCAQQALSDVRALTSWFSAQGCARVGLWGISMGAWLAGLLACGDYRLSFAVLMNPIADMDRAVRELAFCDPIRRSLGTAELSTHTLNLISHQPLLPSNRILIVKSEHDLIAQPDALEQLWRNWNQPEMWRLRHGHISVTIALPTLRRIIEWIIRKTSAGAQEQFPQSKS